MSGLTLASNQGDIGGGEVMLLQIAEAARELGHDVTVVAPESPEAVVLAARSRGFTTVALPSSSTRGYLRNLRRWAKRHPSDLFWCNGLRPAFATAGLPRRIVHLHQIPSGKLALAARLARRGALTTLVPSQFASRALPGSEVMSNWTARVRDDARRLADGSPEAHVTAAGRESSDHDAVRNGEDPVTLAQGGDPDRHVIGYLGRISSDKGVEALVDAVERLVAQGRSVHLLLAGEARFVDPQVTARVDAALARLGHRVERRGWMDRDEFFAAVDLAVFPSVTPESFGLVAAEAMAARCPFVISDAGALPEVAGHGFPYVAKADDSDSLAATIADALDAPTEVRSAQLDRSFARWNDRYSPEAGRDGLARVLARHLPKEVSA